MGGVTFTGQKLGGQELEKLIEHHLDNKKKEQLPQRGNGV
jgi:hypothetical protein